MPDCEDGYEMMQGECPTMDYTQENYDCTDKNKMSRNNPERCGGRCCGICGCLFGGGCSRNHKDIGTMIDYDYKEYRKNCYADIFKEADCHK